MKQLVATLTVIALALPLSAQTVGWRGDGLGTYPNAEPVKEFGREQNVIWKTEMPSWSNATAVPIGAKLFVMAEPTTLVCCDLNSGEILWQRDTVYADVFTDEEKAKAVEDRKALERIEKQLGTLEANMRRIDDKIREIKREAKKTETEPEIPETLSEQRKQLDTMMKNVELQMRPYDYLRRPKTHGSNGYTSPTPVTDGEHVWVVLGTGMVACYDLAGEQVWARKVQKPTHGWGMSASPVLADGVLVVSFVDTFGLDPETGETLWTANVPWGWGTPAVAEIEGEAVVLTTKGHMLKAADGEVLAENLGKLTYNGPVVDDGVVYYIGEGSDDTAKAYRLPQKIGEKPRGLWQVKIPKDRYYGSPLVIDRFVYAINQKGITVVLDKTSGSKVRETRINFEPGGTVYTSATQADDMIFLAGEKGGAKWVSADPQLKELGGGTLEAFRVCPVFVGDRMYIRAQKFLYCFGKE